jgi:hypothetical protein
MVGRQGADEYPVPGGVNTHAGLSQSASLFVITTTSGMCDPGGNRLK